MKQIVHRAFWDNIEEELAKDPPNYDPALRLLGELKEVNKRFLYCIAIISVSIISIVFDLFKWINFF